jgi:hypothetical protein
MKAIAPHVDDNGLGGEKLRDPLVHGAQIGLAGLALRRRGLVGDDRQSCAGRREPARRRRRSGHQHDVARA